MRGRWSAYVLARDSRDGHTVSPAGSVMDALAEFGTGDAQAAVDAAVEAASVIRFEHEGAEDDLGLARYAEAEDAMAQSDRAAGRDRRADQGRVSAGA